jgi:hypothetical protein
MGKTILVVNRSISLPRVSCSVLENSFRFAPEKDAAACRFEKAWRHGGLVHDMTKRVCWRPRYHPGMQQSHEQVPVGPHLIELDEPVLHDEFVECARSILGTSNLTNDRQRHRT